MSLARKQAAHAHRLALLILHAEQLGYLVTGGDWFRDDRCHYGHPQSKHKKRLATDLNLFREEFDQLIYLTETKDYEPLGEYWESIGGIWGGRWTTPKDGNHFESPE